MSYPTFETRLAFFYKEDDNKVKTYEKGTKQFLNDWAAGRVYRDIEIVTKDTAELHQFVEEALRDTQLRQHLCSEIRRNAALLDKGGLASLLLARMDIDVGDHTKIEIPQSTEATWALHAIDGGSATETVESPLFLYPEVYPLNDWHYSTTRTPNGERVLKQALDIVLGLRAKEDDILLQLLYDTADKNNKVIAFAELNDLTFSKLRRDIWKWALTCANVLLSLDVAKSSPLFDESSALFDDDNLDLSTLANTGRIGQPFGTDVFVLESALTRGVHRHRYRDNTALFLAAPQALGVRALLYANNPIFGEPMITEKGFGGWYFYRFLATVVANARGVAIGTQI